MSFHVSNTGSIPHCVLTVRFCFIFYYSGVVFGMVKSGLDWMIHLFLFRAIYTSFAKIGVGVWAREKVACEESMDLGGPLNANIKHFTCVT
jgi:hypothetical protein